MPIEACLGSITGAGGTDDGKVGFIKLRTVCEGLQTDPLRCPE